MQDQNNNRKKVDFVTFSWALGVVFAIGALLFTMNLGYQRDISEIKVNLKEVSVNVEWIMKNIERSNGVVFK